MSNTGPKVISAISVRQHSIFLHVRKIDKFCPFSARGIKLEFPRSVAFYNVVIACSYWCGNGTYSVLFRTSIQLTTLTKCAVILSFFRRRHREFFQGGNYGAESPIWKNYGEWLFGGKTRGREFLFKGGSKIYRPTQGEMGNSNPPPQKKPWPRHFFLRKKKLQPRHFISWKSLCHVISFSEKSVSPPIL